MDTKNDSQSDDKPLTLWQTLGSVLAAFFGVQSSAKRERDFSRGKASHFILIGLATTVTLVVLLVLLVRLVLNVTGG